MSGPIVARVRNAGNCMANGDDRCHYDNTPTLGHGLPIAWPVTWPSKARSTWQTGRTGRSGARTVLRSSCIPSSSPVGGSRLVAKPESQHPTDSVPSLGTRCQRLPTPHSPARPRGSYSARYWGYLPPASLASPFSPPVLASSTARTDREIPEQGGRL
jgi:hypothetical protein